MRNGLCWIFFVLLNIRFMRSTASVLSLLLFLISRSAKLRLMLFKVNMKSSIQVFVICLLSVYACFFNRCYGYSIGKLYIHANTLFYSLHFNQEDFVNSTATETKTLTFCLPAQVKHVRVLQLNAEPEGTSGVLVVFITVTYSSKSSCITS
jgi:hypothetical protein